MRGRSRRPVRRVARRSTSTGFDAERGLRAEPVEAPADQHAVPRGTDAAARREVVGLQRSVGNAAVTLVLQRRPARTAAPARGSGPTMEEFTAANPGIVAALSSEQIKTWRQVIEGWRANSSVDRALAAHEKRERSTMLDPDSRRPIISSDYLDAHARIENRRKFVDEAATKATLDPTAVLAADVTAAQPWNVAAEQRYREWAVQQFAGKPLVAELTSKREIVSQLERTQNPGIDQGIPHVNLLWGGYRMRHTKGIVTWNDLQDITTFSQAYRTTVLDSPEIQALRQGARDIADHIYTMKAEHKERSDANRGGQGAGWTKRKVTGAVRHISEGLGAPSLIEVQIARLRVQNNPTDTDALANLAEIEGRTQDYPRLTKDEEGNPGIWDEPELQLNAAFRFLREGKTELAVAALSACEHSTAIATARFAGYERRVVKGASTAVTWLERAKTAGKIASAFTGTGGVVRAAFGAAGYTFAQEGSQQVVAHWMDESNKIDLAGLIQQSAIDGFAALFGGLTQGAFVKALEGRFLARMIKSGLSEPTARGVLGVAGATTASFYNAPAQIVLNKVIAGQAVPGSLSEVCAMITEEVAMAPVMELAGRYVHSTAAKGEAKATGTEVAPPQQLVEGLSRGEPAKPAAPPGQERPEVHVVGPTEDGRRVLQETDHGDLVVCQRCDRLSKEYQPEMATDETFADREAAVKQIPAGANHDAAARKLEADLHQQRQEAYAKFSEPKLRKLVGDPMAPKDLTAMEVLLSQYAQKTRLELIQLGRRGSKFGEPLAFVVLARGEGRPSSAADYAALPRTDTNLEVLRLAARWDHEAVHELVVRYRDLPASRLETMRDAGDAVAGMVRTEVDRNPRMDVAAEGRLAEAIWNRRHPAVAVEGTEAARHAGTIGAVEIEASGGDWIVAVRGSPEAPQGGQPQPGAVRPFQPPPSTKAEPLPASAHHHAEDQLVNHLDAEFARRGLTDAQLRGRTVRVAVDQGVCQTCASGVAGGRAGVLLQFSVRYPGLRIEIVDIATGSFSVFTNGQRVGHSERVPIKHNWLTPSQHDGSK